MKTPPFKIGDKVTTSFHTDDENIVRVVCRIEKSSKFTSEWGIMVENEYDCCPTCSRYILSIPILIDSSWFTKVEDE